VGVVIIGLWSLNNSIDKIGQCWYHLGVEGETLEDRNLWRNRPNEEKDTEEA